MPTPQEYRSKISQMGLERWESTITSIQDAKIALARIRAMQHQLWELKKGIKNEISTAWDKYRGESKESLGDAIASAFLGKNLSYKIRQRSRTRLADERDQTIITYREVETIIDDLLHQLDANKAKVQTFINQLIAEEQEKRGNSSVFHSSHMARWANYNEYIRSQEWREKAEAAKAQAGNRCQVCNRSRAEVQLEAHHRTYERLGNELPEDITVLCRDCHQLYEDSKKAPSPEPDEILAGFCIRCKKAIKLDPQAPYCYACFKVWKRFENFEYEEKYCHVCGEENTSTMQKPACYSCYKRNRQKLTFQKTGI